MYVLGQIAFITAISGSHSHTAVVLVVDVLLIQGTDA